MRYVSYRFDSQESLDAALHHMIDAVALDVIGPVYLDPDEDGQLPILVGYMANAVFNGDPPSDLVDWEQDPKLSPRWWAGVARE